MNYDQIFGLVWLALGSAMAINSVSLGLGTLHSPGIGFMPFIVGIALGSCGLVLTVLGSLAKKATGNTWKKENVKKFVLPTLYLLIYCFILESLGFLLTTFLFQFFVLKLTAPKKWLNPVLTSLLIVGCSYFLFSFLLNVPLPKGFLEIG